MARRKTVQVDIIKILELTALQGWSAATLAKRVGKHERWFSEIKRGKNLPSPEEAAQMCLLLGTTPEEILLEPADIELVNGLIEQEREKQGIKKAPGLKAGELTDLSIEDWERQAEKWSDSEITKAMQALLRIQERRQSSK